MLARLALGEASVNELAVPFSMSLPVVSKHIKALHKAGLISKGRGAQWRLCRIEGTQPTKTADRISQYKHFWEERLDRLQAYLSTLQSTSTIGEEK